MRVKHIFLLIQVGTKLFGNPVKLKFIGSSAMGLDSSCEPGY